MIEHHTFGDIELYSVGIEPDGGTRRERENAAVRILVEHAFGPGARKENRDNGAPYIILPDGTTCGTVSLSHSHSMAVLATGPAGCGIGADIEEWRATLPRIAPRILSAGELSYYSCSAERLLAAWTLKEALYKALGITGADFARDLPLPLPGGGRLPYELIFSAPYGNGFLSLVKAPAESTVSDVLQI